MGTFCYIWIAIKLSSRAQSTADLRWFALTLQDMSIYKYLIFVLFFHLKQMCFLCSTVPPFLSPQPHFQCSSRLDAHGVEQLEVMAWSSDAVSRY